MKEVGASQRARLAALFEGYKWNYLPDAILEGTMGRALADDAEEPKVAVLEAPHLKLSITGGDPLGYTPQGTYPLVLFAGSKLMAAVTRMGLKVKERAGK